MNGNFRKRQPRLLDLFCCAGGAAQGYNDAGFEVYGVDIVEQPNYPFPMMTADVMKLPQSFLREFDVIHASPPCQAYSDLAARNGNAHEWPQLVGPVREMLKQSGKPWVIENVEGAPLIDPVVLSGTMFPGLRVIRRRLFETNFFLAAPPDIPRSQYPLCHTLDKRKAHYGKTCEWKDFVSVNGGGNCSVASARDAMGIQWMTKKEINEAIPPAYTKWIGKQLMEHIGAMKKKSIKAILKELFLQHKGEILTSAQLQAAIGDGRTEWARRVRELRMDEGWPIETNNDASDLKPGQYRLAGDPPAPGSYRFARTISRAQRARVLERNGYTCQSCGAGVEDKTQSGRPVKLVIDHHEAFSYGGPDDDANLRVLCQECNGGAKNLVSAPPTWKWLMSQVRRAKREDQMKVLEQLEKKFR